MHTTASGARARWTLLLVAAAALAAGCTCRKAAPSDAGVPAAAVDPDWLEGRVLDEPGAPVAGGTLVVRTMAEPAGLNFLDDAHRDAWTLRMTRNLVFESLLEIDPSTFALKPQLAERFETSADGRTQTFFLRRGVRFHDGSPFTAKDVVAVLDAVKAPANRTAGLKGDLSELLEYRAVDDATVTLTWARPSPFSLRHLAKLPIYPAGALQGDFSTLPLGRKPVGTGPYQVASWEAGQELVLVRAPQSATPAWLQEIRFRFVKDHTVAATLLEQGAFDLMTTVQPTVWRAIEAPTPANAWAHTGYRRLRAAENNFSYVAWNEADPALADRRVRQALAHAYPADAVAKNVDLGLELPTTCPFFAPTGACDPALKPRPFALDAARALLADAGFQDADQDGVLERDGAPLRVSFLVPPSSVRLGKIAPLLQDELRKVGVRLEVEKVEPAVLSKRVRERDFGAVSRVWTEFDAEHDLHFLLHSSQADAGANVVGYRSAEADRLLDAIRGELDTAKRRALERALHRLVYEDQPYLLMTTRQTLDLARRRVHGLRPSPLWYDLRAAWVDPAPDAGR